MSTKNLILGAATACLAIGSAVASHSTLTTLRVLLPDGTKPFVTTQSSVTCDTGPKCTIKVKTAGGNFTITGAATILTAAGNNVVAGAGITGTFARTAGS